MPPRSGRQMTSFLSQSQSRNTHLAYSPTLVEGAFAEIRMQDAAYGYARDPSDSGLR